MSSNLKQRQRDDRLNNKIITNRFSIESQEETFKASFQRSCPNTVPVEIAVKDEIMKAIGGSIGPFVAYDSIIEFFRRYGISFIRTENKQIFITYKVKRGFNVSYFENLPQMNKEDRKIIFSALLSLGYDINEIVLDDMEQQLLESIEDDENWKEMLVEIEEIRNLSAVISDEFYCMDSWKELRDTILELKEALGDDQAWNYCIYPQWHNPSIDFVYSEHFDFMSSYNESMFDIETVLIDNDFGVIITPDHYNLYDTILRTGRIHSLFTKISDLLWEN